MIKEVKQRFNTADHESLIPDNITDLFGETLSKLRGKKSISQQSLARTSGLSW